MVLEKYNVISVARSSYERQQLHNIAHEKIISHRSVIDYRQHHVNRGTSELPHSIRPFEISSISYVEFGKGYDNLVIGNEQLLPTIYQYFGSTKVPFSALVNHNMFKYVQQ